MDHSLSFPRSALRVLIAILLGLVVYATPEMLFGLVTRSHPDLVSGRPWLPIFFQHSGMLVLSFLLILLLSRGQLSRYGFCRLGRFASWRLVYLSVGTAAFTYLVGLALPAEGLPFVQKYSILELALFIWIYASIAEEVVFRGMVQSFLVPLAATGLSFRGGTVRISVPVLVPAIFFAVLHLPLLAVGIDSYTVGLIVVAGFCVGLIAGFYREKTGSLLPAILAHVLFNFTGWVMERVVGPW